MIHDDAEQELLQREDEISPLVPITSGDLDWISDPVHAAKFDSAVRAEAENPTPPPQKNRTSMTA